MSSTLHGAERVCAIVVTYNRRELLRRCLKALAGQRRALDATVVVDNASSDGTADMVRAEFPAVQLLRLDRNAGGAGGFQHGLAWGYDRAHDWLWLLDDDTIAQPDTLAALLDGAARAPGGQPLLVTSQVRWTDGRLHPMNRPVARWRDRARMAEAAAHGLVALRYATFVSVALRREAVERFGLPRAEYFIWGDDVEYTARILRHEPGYLVPESRVHHWTAEPHAAAAPTSDRFYFHARNTLLTLRGTSFTGLERVDHARYLARTAVTYVRVNRRDRRRLRLLARALRDGLRGATR
jgi:rhamnopyranosyl-N-acetylglucosaminyl-diphospho-decaprenol beta-1,3/1,4-galactofuranosyltransferase